MRKLRRSRSRICFSMTNRNFTIALRARVKFEHLWCSVSCGHHEIALRQFLFLIKISIEVYFNSYTLSTKVLQQINTFYLLQNFRGKSINNPSGDPAKQDSSYHFCDPAAWPQHINSFTRQYHIILHHDEPPEQLFHYAVS